MKLYVKDRIFFPQLLPNCKSFLEFNLKRSVLGKVSLSKEDEEKYEIKITQETGNVTWNPKVDNEHPLEVSFSTEELALIKRGCESLEEKPYPDDFWQTVEMIYNACNS